MSLRIAVSMVCLVLAGHVALAQEELETSDSTRLLEEVVVKAYQSNRPSTEVPVAIGVVDTKSLNRFGPTSFVSAVNTIPGVRMEERSPGSYRFSIRGSLLRSPFGVRNVKFYWKGLPLTDGGGNTYLNLIDFSAVHSMEIIKGPGSSLYGASTGGVVLLEPTPTTSAMPLEAGAYFGSFGTLRFNLRAPVVRTDRTVVGVSAASQLSSGYREHTAMSRFALNVDWTTALNNKSTISGTLLTSRLQYETPGGLTRAQFEADPRQARPTVGANRGAVDQKAAITNQTEYLGLVYDNDWNENWSTRVGVYGSYTDFANPAILNFEERHEWNWGARTSTEFLFGGDDRKNKLTLGAEFQHLFSPISVYTNDLGTKTNLRSHDNVRSDIGLAFAQTDFALPNDFFFSLGGSMNWQRYLFQRDVPVTIEETKNFTPRYFPRVALLKKIVEDISLFASVSRGYSAPTLAEVLPSTGLFNSNLEAERGTNLEIGFKTTMLFDVLQLSASAYSFRLDETIVILGVSNGADDFRNAGKTVQNGLEATGSYTYSSDATRLRLWASYALNKYRFKNYAVGVNDFSGNSLTGVPADVVAGGLDVDWKKWYLATTLNFTDHLPLNDGNTEYASSYWLVSARLGTRQLWGRIKADIFAGGDNLLDQTYSLGNDLNAAPGGANGRYFNTAPGRNFYVGLQIRLP